MKRVLLLLFVAFIFSRDIYSEIKIDNIPYATLPYLNSIGLDLDHIHYTNDYIQFVISEYDLNKLNQLNVSYEIIHEDMESFYASRLINDFERAF